MQCYNDQRGNFKVDRIASACATLKYPLFSGFHKHNSLTSAYFYTSDKRYYVFLPDHSVYLSVCLSVGHHVSGEMAACAHTHVGRNVLLRILDTPHQNYL